MRPFRFGVVVSNSGSLAEWRDTARKAEDLGYSTLLVADHFGRQLAPMPALVAAAGASTRLRVGTFVLDNDFRHPAALAKEAATVDLLTDGRFEFGLGAGWNPADYDKIGETFEPAGVRVSRLEEALQIMHAFFGEEAVSFRGKYYTIDGLEAWPKPVQRPRPPIMLGANGPRMLRLAARYADILNFPDRPPVGVSTAGNPGLGIYFPEQMHIVREAAGDRFDGLELSVLGIPRVTDRPRETAEELARQMQTTPDIVEGMPGALIGSVDAIVDRLQANREQFGITYVVVHAGGFDMIAPIVARLAGK